MNIEPLSLAVKFLNDGTLHYRRLLPVYVVVMGGNEIQVASPNIRVLNVTTRLILINKRKSWKFKWDSDLLVLSHFAFRIAGSLEIEHM